MPKQEAKREISKGDLPALILGVLSDGALHGYAIAREVERRTQSRFTLREGSLYPALRALEENGFVQSEWNNDLAGASRRVYTLTDAGRAELEKRARGFAEYVAAMKLFLGGQADEQTA